MKKYLLSLYQPAEGKPSPELLARVMRNLETLNAEMRAADAWVFAGGLYPPDSATVVRFDGDEMHTTEGPYLSGKETLGGFTVVAAPDVDSALDWGRKLALATSLPVEVRPFRDSVLSHRSHCGPREVVSASRFAGFR